MVYNPRHLITTADERTWKFDRPVLFLGEWCRHYNRKQIWNEMDAIVANPYGLGQEQKDRDYTYTRFVEEELTIILQQKLNEYHKTNYSLRFWRILLGHWLHRYVSAVFNRYQTLKQCLGSHFIGGTTLLVSNNYHLATQDSLSFIWALNDDIWNNILSARILEFFDLEDLRIDQHPLKDNLRGYGWIRPKNRKIGWRIKKTLYQNIIYFTDFLAGDEDALIINSYLPIIEALKLQFSLGQIPRILLKSSQIEHFGDPSSSLREKLAKDIAYNYQDKFFLCACKLLFELLPVCYLEGFNHLQTTSQKLNWPKKPKFILTTNNFDMDEGFKCWAAIKTEEKIPYFTGQHGNNYGTYRYANPTIEEATADQFLTWGWTDGMPQHTPAFIFKTAGQRQWNCDPQGRLLLIEFPCPHRITTWDGHAEFQAYFNDQKIFINSLSTTCRENLTIRLHAEYRYHDWSEETQWHDFDATLNIDPGEKPIRELIAASRLVVHSYDSTGILETLSENVPTLAFWQNRLEHLRDSALPYYQLLIDAEIIHLSPESIAQKVNDIWNNVSEWWYGTKVQDAREKFCDRYARTSQQPVKELKQILTKYDL